MRKFVLLVVLAVMLVTVLAFSAAPAFACASYSPGYWMNHSEAWPGSGVWVGGQWYNTANAIAWMRTPPRGDKSITAFFIVTAAALDVYESWGGDRTAWFDAANAWVAANPPGSGVPASSASWMQIEPTIMLISESFE